jgi:hypothetical protein
VNSRRPRPEVDSSSDSATWISSRVMPES